MPRTHRRPYPSDLSDAEWALLEPLLASPERRGRPSAQVARTPGRRRGVLPAALRLRLAHAPAGVPAPWQTV